MKDYDWSKRMSKNHNKHKKIPGQTSKTVSGYHLDFSIQFNPLLLALYGWFTVVFFHISALFVIAIIASTCAINSFRVHATTGHTNG